MWAYIIGGSGILVGAILTLWFWRKATKAQGDLALEKKTSADLADKLKIAIDATETERQKQATMVTRHAEELSQKEAELAVHRKNEDALRDALAKGGVDGLIALANNQYGVVSPRPPGK